MKTVLRLLPLFAAVAAVAAVVVVARPARAQAIDTTHHDTVSSRRYLAKGDAAMKAGQPDSARAAYEKAIQYDADDIDAILKMTNIMIDEGHGSFARDLLKFALQRHPDDPRLLHYRYVRPGADTTGAASVGP